MTEISSSLEPARQRLLERSRHGVDLVTQIAELVAERDELRHQVEMLTAGQRPTEAQTPGMLTVEEAAGLARCNPKTIRRAFHSGKLTAFRPGGGRTRVLLREEDVRAWLQGQTAAPPPSEPRRSRSRSRRSTPASVQALREIERELTR